MTNYILCSNGWYYTSDILTVSPTLQSSFTGGKLLRRVAGVSGGVAAYVNKQAWSHEFDFTTGQHGWDVVAGSPAFGYYTPSVGFTRIYDRGGSLHSETRFERSVFGTMNVDSVDLLLSYSGGGSNSGGTDGFYWDIGTVNTIYNPTLPVGTETTGTLTVGGIDYTNMRIDMFASDVDATLTTHAATINGTGDNPFGVGQIKYSSNDGATVSTIEIAGSGYAANGCFDSDDYAAGVFVVGNGVGIRYTSSYTGSASLLTGLTGLDDTAKVVCIRIPYLKLATQADNDTASSMQFIYGVDAAVSGKTLWGVTFNASTGAIIAESDMTPVISATTYRPISQPNALATYGGNTQRVALLATSGGATRLLVSSDGGTSWLDRGALDATSIEFISPANSGTGSQLFACGSAIGVRYSSNFGVSFTNISGDLNVETSLTNAIKAIAI